MVKSKDNKKRGVVFHFAGTGEGKGNNQYDFYDEGACYDEGVLRIYIHGCQNENVGNSRLNPDLQRVVERIKRACSGSGEGAKLNLETLKKELKSGLHCITVGSSNATSQSHGFAPNLIQEQDETYGSPPTKLDLNQTLPEIEIDKIALTGFSRGAVTTFAVAKGLDHLNVPMSIVANQPVPGETGKKNSRLRQYADCSHLKNLERGFTILAQHDTSAGGFQNTYFQQMVPKFPKQAEHQAYFIPTQSHFQKNQGVFLASQIGLNMHACGFVSDNKVKALEAQVKNYYRTGSYSFTPRFLQQSVYGVKNNEELSRDRYFEADVKQKAQDYVDRVDWKSDIFGAGEDRANNSSQFRENLAEFEPKDQYLLSIFNYLTQSDPDEASFELSKECFKQIYLDTDQWPEKQKELLSEAIIDTYELARYYEAKILRNNLPVPKAPAEPFLKNGQDHPKFIRYKQILERNMALKKHVQQHTREYVSNVLKAQYKYITQGDALSQQSQTTLYSAVKGAGKKYSNGILREKGFIHSNALRISLDIVSHLMIIGMVANLIKKWITGKWLISRTQTKPDNLAKKNIGYFKKSLDQVKHKKPSSGQAEQKEDDEERGDSKDATRHP